MHFVKRVSLVIASYIIIVGSGQRRKRPAPLEFVILILARDLNDSVGSNKFALEWPF